MQPLAHDSGEAAWPFHPEVFKVPGFRYPLQAKAMIRVRGRRGMHLVNRVDLHEDGRQEVRCWWTSGPKGNRGQWVTVRVDAITKIGRVS